MADIFDTGQVVAKPLSALSQKGVDNRTERLNADVILNADDSTFLIKNTSGVYTIETKDKVAQDVAFQFKIRMGGDDGVAFLERSTGWLADGATATISVPSPYPTRPFILIVSTAVEGDKPAFTQQFTVPAWPAAGATLTYNTVDGN